VSRGVQQAVKASTRKIRMGETERRRIKERSWKKEERKG